MRILLLKPYAGRTRELELCQRVARPDTQIEFRNLEGEFPISHVHHRYFRYKAIDHVLEHVMRAEQEGFDGVCIACGADPGLLEARELINIPITSTFESGGHIASTMGQKFSVLTTVYYAIPNMEELARLYGFDHKLASVRSLRIPGRNLYGGKTSPDEIVARINEVARQCFEEDGAEVILLTATLAATIYAEAGLKPITDNGMPIVDSMVAAFKMVEMMVDLHQLGGIPPISRVSAFREPYEPEYRAMRSSINRPLYRGLPENPGESSD
jgi:allantoin racemase